MKITGIDVDLSPELTGKLEQIVRKCCSKPADPESLKHFAALGIEFGIELMHKKLYPESEF
jgi:hypothetical protein